MRSAMYEKSSILLAGTGVSIKCGLSPFEIHFSDYLKCSISRINEVYVFSIKKIFIYNRRLLQSHSMVSVTSASLYVTSASRYQSRSSMVI